MIQVFYGFTTKQIGERTFEAFQNPGLKNIAVGFKPMSPVTCISITGEN